MFAKRKCGGYQHDLIFKQHQPKSSGKPPPNDKNCDATKKAVTLPSTIKVSSYMLGKGMPLEECTALIISKCAPWLLHQEAGNLDEESFRTCGS
jgi:hypothetical protein